MNRSRHQPAPQPLRARRIAVYAGIAVLAAVLLICLTIVNWLKPPGIADARLAFEQQSLEELSRSGDVAAKLGRLSEAEEFYRRVLKHQPDHLAANQGLLNLLRIEGRNWDALPAVYHMLRRRKFVFEHLAMAGPWDAVWLNEDRDIPYLEFCGRAEPQDLLYQLGPIRSQMMEDADLDQARQGLLGIVAWNPNLLEAQAALGQLLFNSGDQEAYLGWQSRLPETADRHPSIWLTRARWARGQGQSRAAIRCLWEALRLNPNDRAANLLMAKLVAEIGDREQAALFQRRGDDLVAFDNLLMWGSLQELETRDQVASMIQLLERLGRLWEARGWCDVLLGADPRSPVALAAIARLDPQLTPDTPLTLASENPANRVDYSGFPLPVVTPSPVPTAGEEFESALSFADVAPQAKLDFTYFVDKPRLADRVYTFDFAGGGVGVLDYDLDGWPDLYLTQSCVWPPIAGPPADAGQTPRNRLFRNGQGLSFEDITPLAGVDDVGFGNGLAVGDVDGDGFPDLYVNNLGPNRLYLNNGDGTFTDVTEASGTAGNDYSLSAVFVDLNLDGLPELYVVNYLAGDAMTRQCRRGGKPIQCSPVKFPGQQDRLYVNLGDGRFRDATSEAGILDPQGIGKGMDVVAANLDGQGGPDLFVANDTTANFLFVNKSKPGEQTVRLVEQGALSGVAYDELGRVQSSMGIAAADANHDGLLDLFVTNFYRERNELYVQTMHEPMLLFRQEALVMNLSEPSLQTMGWGTQFLDAELDGDWDLAVANGYLDQNTSGDGSGKMRPQFFENRQAATFRELPARQLGPYFAAEYFGRAMARLDWNRDGLADLCMTHLEAPVALLQNTSRRQGRFIAIELHGVLSSRDAIGTTLEITAGGKSWTVQQTAGGGFEAASQQQILVGLGQCDMIEQLRVRWPDESVQVFRDLPADQAVILIQGRPAPVVRRAS